jgi:hypothetical protein
MFYELGVVGCELWTQILIYDPKVYATIYKGGCQVHRSEPMDYCKLFCQKKEKKIIYIWKDDIKVFYFMYLVYDHYIV